MDVLSESYLKLTEDLKAIIEEARQKADFTSHLILIESYWKLGQRLSDESLTQKELSILAEELNFERTQLPRFIKFYLTWKDGCPAEYYQNLTWSHYRALSGLKDPDAIDFYLQNCERNNWSVRVFSQKIKDQTFKKQAGTRGRDSKKTSLSEAPSSSASSAALKLTRSDNSLHIYKTSVDRVVDGDTLVTLIDLGFDVLVKKRIRLNGINCPEMNSDDPQERARAQEAYAFVKARLPKASTVVIQTFKIDLHSRFVADVFYLPGETSKEKIFKEGNWLNQELLDAGLADLF